MAVIVLVLLIASAVCFVVAAFNATSRVNLIAAGLFLWVLTVLIEAASGVI